MGSRMGASPFDPPTSSAQATVQSFHAPGVDPSPLHADGHLLVEQLSCYFPVRFSPLKSDPHGITRLMVSVDSVDSVDRAAGVENPVASSST